MLSTTVNSCPCMSMHVHACPQMSTNVHQCPFFCGHVLLSTNMYTHVYSHVHCPPKFDKYSCFGRTCHNGSCPVVTPARQNLHSTALDCLVNGKQDLLSIDVKCIANGCKLMMGCHFQFEVTLQPVKYTQKGCIGYESGTCSV
jgi:hypothetical protein